MGWFRRACVTAAALVLGWCGGLAAAEAAPALWVVHGEHADVYLFGTLHALDARDRWRTPAYDAAYARARQVWFEADLGGADPQTVGELVGRYGVDARRTLSQKLPPAELAALRRQVDLARIEHLRPWAAALMLSMQPALERGARVEAGADLVMTRAARDAAKPVRTFETLEDQARMFAGLPEEAEVRYLADAIRETSSRPRLSFRRRGPSLEQAWLDGDLARLGPLVEALQAQNPGFYQALLKRRNLAWAEVLAGELTDPGAGVQLVNVGALHLVGPDGLPALLAARGFRVERIQ